MPGCDDVPKGIPQTQKKLREAKFFLRQMEQAAKTMRLDLEDFDFYLSAFLGAGRSVTLCLQAEQKESYDFWFPKWEKSLSDDDRELLVFMNLQRVAAVHEVGPEVVESIEYFPTVEIERDLPVRGRRIRWWGPVAVTAPRIGRKERYFEIGEVLETSEWYVGLLQSCVQGFESSQPNGSVRSH